MIQKLNPLLEYAEKKNIAIGAFTATTMRYWKSIVEVAEKRKEPIILKLSAVYEEDLPLKTIGPMIVELAKNAKVDVCPMYDHAKDPAMIKEAFKMGFTAVMYDGASLPFEENVKIGKEVVNLAKSADANIEASIGVVFDKDSKISNIDEIVKFVNEVDIDAIAPSLGRRDRIMDFANIDCAVLKTIAEKTKMPLVLHGAGYNLSKDDIRSAIKSGVRKVNYFSYADVNVAKTYFAETPDKDVSREELMNLSCKAVAEDIEKAMEIFSMK